MHTSANVQKAVEAAIKHDMYCGGEIHKFIINKQNNGKEQEQTTRI